MKNVSHTSPKSARSKTKKNAGLSLLRPRLFSVVNDTYKYFNEIFRNISKTIVKTVSPFIARLISKKFPNSSFLYTGSKIRIRFDSHLKIHWINFKFVPKNSLSLTFDPSF